MDAACRLNFQVDANKSEVCLVREGISLPVPVRFILGKNRRLWVPLDEFMGLFDDRGSGFNIGILLLIGVSFLVLARHSRQSSA